MQHLDFFKGLLEKLNNDLQSMILNKDGMKDRDFENLINAVQFSYAMGFDEKDLWFKMYQALLNVYQNKEVPLSLKMLMKALNVYSSLEELAGGEEEVISLDQIEALRSHSMDRIAYALRK